MENDPDRNKRVQKIIFSRKLKKTTHPSLVLDNSNASLANSQKHLRTALDFKLVFNEHLGNALNKPTGFLRKLQNSLTRKGLITIYKAFIRPHLDYDEVLYH